MILVVIAVALFAAIVLNGLRQPLVRRIGLRNARRRPREAALVMLGCILGTGVIVGNLSVGDSLTASIVRQALGDYGNLDAIVDYETKSDWAAASAQLAVQPLRGVAAATPVATVSAPVTRRGGDGVSPRAKLIEADYRRAGDLASAPGVPPGSGPTAGTTWVSERAARELGLTVGDTVRIHTSAELTLRVGRVVKNSLTSFLDGSYRAGDSYLVPPGTIDALQTRDPTLVFPDYRTLVVADQPHTAKPAPAAATEALRRELTRVTAPFNGDVSMSRASRLAAAAAQGATTGAFLTTIGSLGILAGLLLLINVLLMLAEERLSEMGTMRAVGMSRNPLIGAFSLEGALYAAVGSLLGGGLGVLLGRVLVRFMDQMTNDASDGDFRGLPLRFAIERPTLLTGIALGFVVATVAVVATSYRVSRLEVIRALRDLPSSPRRHRQAATPLVLLALVLGPAVAYVGYTGPSPVLLVLGPILFFSAIGVSVNRRYGFEAGMVTATVPLTVFGMLFNVFNQQTVVSPTGGVLAGTVTAVSGVLLLNAVQGRIAGVFRRIGRGRQSLPTRLGLANPIAHRVRMLLTVMPFALVVFTLTYTEGLGNLVTTELRAVAPTFAGDYTVFADSSSVNAFDFKSFRSAGLTHVARTGTRFATFTYDPTRNSKVWPVTAFDEDLFAVTPPLLVDRAKEYRSDVEAYRAVLDDPDLVIIDPNFLFEGIFGTGSDDPASVPKVGDSYTMFNPVTGQARDVRVAATRYPDVLGNGPLYGAPGARQMFGDQLVLSDAFLVHRGDHGAFIDDLQRAGIDHGVQARDTKLTSEAATGTIKGLINLFRADLGIGITVGVAGIGVVLIRSVRDRRRTIGTLRAMGVDASEVGRSFMIEGAFVAVQGLIVGVVFSYLCVLALPKTNLIRSLLGFEPGLPSPPPTVLFIAVGLFLAALLASVLPARAASRIPPAVALRLVD
jgi:putative ABC transport system permease protein